MGRSQIERPHSEILSHSNTECSGMQKLKQLFQGNLYRYGQLIISLANKPKTLTSPHAFPYRHHRLFDPAKTMQRAISDSSSATKKKKNKQTAKGAVGISKPQQINKRTQRVMRAKISLFKDQPETGFRGRQQKSLLTPSWNPWCKAAYLSFAGSTRRRYGPGQ